jgi:hypothetical protein
VVILKKKVIFAGFLYILFERSINDSKLEIIVELSEKSIFQENSSRELEMS